MFWAINKTTNKKVKSTFIFKDPEYQFPRKDKWIAPEESEIDTNFSSDARRLPVLFGFFSIH